MTSPLTVSMVVPIYNVQEFLPRCLDSILAQDHEALEVILVNDGSPDDSAQIIRRYDEENPGRFVVITQENQGLGMARNNGIKAATGEFICFVDSDDWIEPTYVSTMAERAQRTGADVVVSTCWFELNDGPRLPYPFMTRRTSMTGEEAAKLALNLFSIQTNAWNKLYRRSLFLDNDIVFPSIYYEDVATTTPLLACARRVELMNVPLYHYCYRTTGITGNFSQRNVDDYLTAIGMLRDFLHREGFWDDWQPAWRQHLRRVRTQISISTFVQDRSVGMKAKRHRLRVLKRRIGELGQPVRAEIGDGR